MKTIKACLVCFLLCVSVVSKAQVTYSSDNIFQVGRDTYTPVYFESKWSIDVWEQGLNFWKPWGSSYSGNYKLFLDQTGMVGIGRKPTSYKLEVAGDIYTTGTIRYSSDTRLKSNIKNLDVIGCLDKLNLLTGKSYYKAERPAQDTEKEIREMIASGKIKPEDASAALQSINDKQQLASKGTLEFGFLAQEVQTIFPELVTEDKEGYLAIDYMGLIPVIIESIKEMKEVIDAQNELINELKGDNGKIKASSYAASDNTVNEAYLVSGSGASVSYQLPQTYTEASLLIYDQSGNLVKRHSLDNSAGKVDGINLTRGTYIYTLVVDGVKKDTLKKSIN